MASKLEKQIKESLESNPDVTIVEYFPVLGGEFYLKDGTVAPLQTQYVVAPKDGLYTVEELQKFMMELMPDLKPAQVEEFYISNDCMVMGSLYFTERIGRETTKTTFEVIDKELAEEIGYRGNTEQNVKRTWVKATSVHVYPNQNIAEGLNPKGKKVSLRHSTAGRNYFGLDEIKKHQKNKK